MPIRYKLFNFIVKRMGYHMSLKQVPHKQFILTKITGMKD